MLNLFKWLLGIQDKKTDASTSNSSFDYASDLNSQAIQNSKNDIKASNDAYFNNMLYLNDAIKKQNYEQAVSFAKQGLKTIRPFVESELSSSDSFMISTIPIIESGGNLLAIYGEREALEEMKAIITSTDALEPWQETIEEHISNVELVNRILDAIKSNPQCLQTDVKKIIEYTDGKQIAKILYWLDKTKKIIRTKHGKTYSLHIPDASEPIVQQGNPEVGSHRKSSPAASCIEIDLTTIEYVPLPKAPGSWETKKKKKRSTKKKKSADWFEISDTEDWSIESVDKVPMSERPDIAFRKICPLDDGLLLIDDLGNSELSGQAPVALIKYNRTGKKVSEIALDYDIYRIGINPLSTNFICMSRECIIHAYNKNIESLLKTSLHKTPEIINLTKRLDIDIDNLKNHLRTVSISSDGTRYLVTGVDEAWCIDIDGNPLWSIKLPVKEGWKRVAEPSDHYGTSEEIKSALSILEMEMPFTPDELKSKYRTLAKQWHPDLNPNNPSASDKMKDITNAVELLTGIDSKDMSSYSGATFMKDHYCPVKV